MPTLKEVYQRAVERGGEDSRFAKAVKKQMEFEEKRTSAEQHFTSGGRPFDNEAPEKS